MGERSNVATALVLGLCLAVGPAAGGWFIGKGMSRFRADTRTVTVKGLVEREVKSDAASWTLFFRRASDTLADAHARISADREAVLGFLKNQGFPEAELERQPTRTLDRLAQDFGGENRTERFRYVVTSAVVVQTADVERVRTAVGATEQLLKAGVVLDSANQGAIQIFGTDGNDESAPFSPTSTAAKKIRVVSTFEFELN